MIIGAKKETFSRRNFEFHKRFSDMKEAVAIKTARSKETGEKVIFIWKNHKQNTALKIDGTFSSHNHHRYSVTFTE